VAELFISSLGDLFTVSTLAYLLLGTAIGFAVGILPGLGGPVALAIMIPFVFVMEPLEAFAFLLSMLAVTGTTGDITSVLLGIPGEAATVTTVLDGYPMTQRGEAGRALGIVLTTSTMGAWFGAIVLAIIMPIIRPIVLSFGPPELLMLSILGLAFVAGLVGDRPLKGLLAVLLGLMLTGIGTDSQAAIPRYVFGQLYLWQGVHIVPVVVGLFGGAEVLLLIMSRVSAGYGTVENQVTGVMDGVKDAFRHWWLTLRASAIGVSTGIMPGVGGVAAQFIAYSHARQSSKEPEKFGKGSIEGLVASGAVNNAKEGGQLVPTVAFGIPGSGLMAILLGAFLILGLRPGPSMLGENLNLTFSMVWIIILANAVAVSLAFAFVKPLTHITQIDSDYLVPGIFTLITIGAYTANNSVGDLLVMLGATVIGVLFIRYDWPRPPLILALVLGAEIERSFFLSYQLYQWSWVLHPIVMILAAITVLGLVLPWLSRRRKAGGALSRAVAARPEITYFPWEQIALTAVLLGVGVYALLEAQQWPFRSLIFPSIVAVALVFLAVISLLLDLRHVRQGATRQSPADARSQITVAGEQFTLESQAAAEEFGPSKYQTASGAVWAMGAGWTAGFLVGTWLLGQIAFSLFALAYMRVRRGSWVVAAVYAAATWAFMRFVMEGVLRMTLPPGLLSY